MFLEAVKNRPIIFPKEKALETINTTPPLTAEEIQKAVSIHLQKEGSIQKQIYKPYYDVWLLFLKENGEKDLKRPTLPTETSQPIFDQEDLFRFSKTSQNFKSLSTKTLKPVENLSVIKVKPIKSKCYNGVYRAEANIIINNTENIEEIFIDRDIEEKPRNSDAFAKTINGHFIEPVSKRVNDYKAITFYTQNYYQESLRLSRNPDLYLKKDKNPILLYIPENLDFKTTREKEKAFINNKKSSGLSAVILFNYKNLIYSF